MAHANVARRDKSQDGIVPVNQSKEVFLDVGNFIFEDFFLLTEL